MAALIGRAQAAFFSILWHVSPAANGLLLVAGKDGIARMEQTLPCTGEFQSPFPKYDLLGQARHTVIMQLVPNSKIQPLPLR